MKVFTIRGFVVAVFVLFSLPFSCAMDDEDCEGTIGKILLKK
ncbi:MAG: hypothetical protein QMC40_08115 [Vicingaceae bacterium]|tara:strand:- start:620 stop:745 length:126 start_codon:yes stop_codon:yes gene_type:complete